MPPKSDYPVGYKKPPRHSQFQPGQSGNPRAGRKRADDFACLFSETLDETVTVSENGRRRKISKRELLVKQVVDRAARGEPKGFAPFFRLMNEIDRERKSGVRPTVNLVKHEDGTVSTRGWVYASLEDYQRGRPPIRPRAGKPPDPKPE